MRCLLEFAMFDFYLKIKISNLIMQEAQENLLRKIDPLLLGGWINNEGKQTNFILSGYHKINSTFEKEHLV
jgi:hypothetical protein